MPSYWYRNFLTQMGGKVENLNTDSLYTALYGTGYTPSTDNDIAYAVAAPPAPTGTPGGSGGPGARSEYYKTTFVNAMGESLPSAETTVNLTAGQVTTITSPVTPGGSVTGYNVYGALTSGNEKLQNVSPIALGTSWVEPAGGLTTSGASVPSANTAQIGGEVATGLGYTAGGILLTSTAWSKLAANSYATLWAASTGYVIGQVVRPATANGNVYLCVAAGTSGSSAPAWGTTRYGITTDGTTTWMCLGTTITRFNAGNVAWTVTGIISYRYAVCYDQTTKDLAFLYDPGSTQNGPSTGTLNINWDSAAGLALLA